MILADLGAEVVKIERPGVGDDTRSWGPPWVGDESSYFLSVNRNKKSVTLDLREREDLESARELVRNADVVVQNFLPGTMDRLGLGYDAAVGGLMSITGPDPKTPTKVGVAVVDVITGLHASGGILAALRHRDRTGEGQHVEVNLLSSLLSALANQSSGYVAAGVVPQAMGNRHPSIAPYEVFDTADRPLVLAVGNDRQFSSLTEVLGVSELAADARFASNSDRVAHREELFDAVTAALAKGSADSWFEALTERGVPCGPLNDIADAIALAERLNLDPVVSIDDPRRDAPTRQVANPIRMSGTPATYRSAPPRLGEDSVPTPSGVS
ncbi:hypothetical protein P4O66_022158 [Electrophorus voltai]|uniref:Uncharacterized protein n=1 Tax=Electrophorus voltai TaxID=2609070 RepID=A0AAD9DLA0_9TELE|nr:hypothetical protein P4O66_022158 [Electrophorus voltai]